MKTWHYVALAYLGIAAYRANKYGIRFIDAFMHPLSAYAPSSPGVVGLVLTKDGITLSGSIAADAKVDSAVGEMIRAAAAGDAMHSNDPTIGL